MAETGSKFIYMLNAMENAGAQENPAAHGYGIKRIAVLEYVTNLERAQAEAETAERCATICERYGARCSFMNIDTQRGAESAAKRCAEAVRASPAPAASPTESPTRSATGHPACNYNIDGWCHDTKCMRDGKCKIDGEVDALVAACEQAATHSDTPTPRKDAMVAGWVADGATTGCPSDLTEALALIDSLERENRAYLDANITLFDKNAELRAALEAERKRKAYYGLAFGRQCDKHANDDAPAECVFCALEQERQARTEAEAECKAVLLEMKRNGIHVLSRNCWCNPIVDGNNP